MDAPIPDLTELYFDSLGGAGRPMAPAMALALQSSFGSVERWKDEFAALAAAHGGDARWMLLTFHLRAGRLVNQRADPAHERAGRVPLLALDRSGHSHPTGFAGAAGRHVDAFIDDIDWSKVYERYQRAVEASSESFGAMHADLRGARVLDVRRAGVFEQATTTLPGADWRDPKDVDAWCATLPKDQPVVVYCVYGHEVGRSTALRLRAAGIDARFLRGGIDGWQAAGEALVPKPGLRGTPRV
jgi:superoxide dismutase, Fe-Mn family